MPAYTTLRTETEAGVRSLVLCRPDEYNTITPALRDDLVAAVGEAEADPEVRVILLRAEGPAFSSGHDLREMQCAGDEADVAKFREMLSRYCQAVVDSDCRTNPWTPENPPRVSLGQD